MSDLVEITHLINGKKLLAVFGSTDSESSDDSLVDLVSVKNTIFLSFKRMLLPQWLRKLLGSWTPSSPQR